MKFKFCLSYVVYGENPKYFSPLLETISGLCGVDGVAVCVFTDFKFQFPDNVISQKNIFFTPIPDEFSHFKRAARFCAADIVSSDFYHFCDSDSIFTDTEKLIADLQYQLSIPAVVIRNHPLHVAPILAGMFSLNEVYARILRDKAFAFSFRDGPYYDQVFLARELYPLIRSDIMAFSSSIFYFGEKRVFIEFDPLGFCGMPIDFKGPVIPSKLTFRTAFFNPLLARPLQSPRFAALWFFVNRHLGFMIR